MPAEVDGYLRVLAGGLAEPLRGLVLELVSHPGKRLRSRLLVACAGTRADTALLARLGAVVELVHLASLLHDDIIDDAATRRGRPATHAVAGAEFATLAGIACLALASKEAADLGPAVSAAVSDAVADLTVGELLDVERAYDIALPVEDYVDLVARKTGALFGLACALGALTSGGADRATVELFGTEWGIAFQILDDCLDLDPSMMDKPAGTDHVLGLFGAPTLIALRADHDGALARLLLSASFTEADLPVVRAMVVDRAGLTGAAALARHHRDRARAALADVPDADVRAALDAELTAFWRKVA